MGARTAAAARRCGGPTGGWKHWSNDPSSLAGAYCSDCHPAAHPLGCGADFSQAACLAARSNRDMLLDMQGLQANMCGYCGSYCAKAQLVGNALYGLKSLGDSAEVRGLVAVLTQKVAQSTEP